MTRVPWDGAPVSPDARMFFAGETKIVVNPDSVVWFPAGDVEATVHLKPVDLGYDEFERLIESNPHEATIALRNGRHARLCLTYWLNKNPRFYTAGEEEPQIGFTDGDGIWVLEREGDAHERFIREWQRGMSWNQQLQRAGARYMNDCKKPEYNHLGHCSSFQFGREKSPSCEAHCGRRT